MEPNRPVPLVGGSALPFGVMMRAGRNVAVAVRRPHDGILVSETFPLAPARLSGSRIGRLPLVRGPLSVRTASATGRQALEVMGRLAGIDAKETIAQAGPLARAAALASIGALAVIQVLLFRVAPIVVAKEAGLEGFAFLAVEAAIRLTLLIGALRLIAFTPQARQLLAYHGAEHMAIACFEAGGPLSVSRAARCSRFHRRCGTSFLVGSALISLLVYWPLLALPGGYSYPVLIVSRILLAPLVGAIAIEGQRLVSRGEGRLARILSAPGLAAQRLTTAPPQPEQLEVAVRALGEVLAAGGAGLGASDLAVTRPGGDG